MITGNDNSNGGSHGYGVVQNELFCNEYSECFNSSLALGTRGLEAYWVREKKGRKSKDATCSDSDSQR